MTMTATLIATTADAEALIEGNRADLIAVGATAGEIDNLVAELANVRHAAMCGDTAPWTALIAGNGNTACPILAQVFNHAVVDKVLEARGDERIAV